MPKIVEYMEHGSLYDLLHNETMAIEGELILPLLKDITQVRATQKCKMSFVAQSISSRSCRIFIKRACASYTLQTLR